MKSIPGLMHKVSASGQVEELLVSASEVMIQSTLLDSIAALRAFFFDPDSPDSMRKSRQLQSPIMY